MWDVLRIMVSAGAVALLPQTIAAENVPSVRVHVLGIVGHKNYDTVTKSLAGARISSDAKQPVVTDASGWAEIRTRSCEIDVTAPGFEPTHQRIAPYDMQGCPNTTEVTLMSTAIITNTKLRRYVDVAVYDAATGRGLAGASVAGVLYYDGADKPRLSQARRTDARGHARIQAFVRLDLSSNHWWRSMDRLDLAVAKTNYVSEIDTITPIGTSDGLSPKAPLNFEIRLEHGN